MPTVHDVTTFLEEFAPSNLAADWDNVGLLFGDRKNSVRRVMTCLTITPASAAEAIAESVDLIVTHHPLPFRPMKRLTTDSVEGKLLWDLAGARISILSPHTAFDSARGGINQRFAEGLGLTAIAPLIKDASQPDVGTARFGAIAGESTLEELALTAKEFLKISHLQLVGCSNQAVCKVAIVCGSAGEFLRQAHIAGCDCLITGETRFHTCLEAESLGIGLILTGHFASERFALDYLADVLAQRFADLSVWASRQESDPLHWI